MHRLLFLFKRSSFFHYWFSFLFISTYFTQWGQSGGCLFLSARCPFHVHLPTVMHLPRLTIPWEQESKFPVFQEWNNLHSYHMASGINVRRALWKLSMWRSAPRGTERAHPESQSPGSGFPRQGWPQWGGTHSPLVPAPWRARQQDHKSEPV